MAPLIEPPSRRPRIALSTSAPPCSGTCSSCPDSLRPSSSRVSWVLPATSVTRAEASTTLTVPAYQCDDVVGSGAVWAGRPGDDPADDLLAGGAGGEFCQPCCHIGGQRHARAGGPGLQRGGHLVGEISYLQGAAHNVMIAQCMSYMHSGCRRAGRQCDRPTVAADTTGRSRWSCVGFHPGTSGAACVAVRPVVARGR